MIVLPDVEDKLEISIEQINSNSYGGDKLFIRTCYSDWLIIQQVEKLVARTPPV